jgi:hypothetical protein
MAKRTQTPPKPYVMQCEAHKCREAATHTVMYRDTYFGEVEDERAINLCDTHTGEYQHDLGPASIAYALVAA